MILAKEGVKPQVVRTPDSGLASQKFRERLETSDLVSSTRSAGMNLARRFNAGITYAHSRRVATIESSFRRRYATRGFGCPSPGVERPG